MSDLQRRITPWLALALGTTVGYAVMGVRPAAYVVSMVFAGIAGFLVVKDVAT